MNFNVIIITQLIFNQRTWRIAIGFQICFRLARIFSLRDICSCCVDSRGAMPVQGPPGTVKIIQIRTNCWPFSCAVVVFMCSPLSWRIVVRMNGIRSELIMLPSVLINDDSGGINNPAEEDSLRIVAIELSNLRMICYHSSSGLHMRSLTVSCPVFRNIFTSRVRRIGIDKLRILHCHSRRSHPKLHILQCSYHHHRPSGNKKNATKK